MKFENGIELLMPAPEGIYRAYKPWLLFVGCLSLYGFVLLKLPMIQASRFFLALMLLAFFISASKAPRSAQRDPVWLFILAAFAISIFIYLWSNIFFPAYAEPYPSTDKLLNLCLFFPVAWWLGGQQKNVFALLAVALIGFAIELLLHGSWTEFLRGVSGARVDFEMRNAQHTAIFFSIAFLGWIVFVKRIIVAEEGKIKALRILLWLAVMIVLGTGCIITQTRIAWIGVVIALLTVAVIVLMVGRFSPKQIIVGSIVSLAIVTSLSIPLSKTISARLGVEQDVIEQLLKGEVESLPYSSIGIRVHTWVEAWQWIKQRPITGWGYAVRGKVIDESNTLPDWLIKQFGHFHNSYIEIWLSYGLIGLAFVTSLVLMVARNVWRTWRSGILPGDIFLFGIAFAVFWLLVNLTESYLLWSTGVYFMALVGGCLYTFPLSQRLKL